jgi:hypothetical protein
MIVPDGGYIQETYPAQLIRYLCFYSSNTEFILQSMK